MKRILFVVIVVMLMSTTACQTLTCKTYTESKHMLKSIVLDNSVDGGLAGNFFLLSGYLKSEQTFSFYEVTEDGSFHLRQIPAASALVYEDAESEAWVEKKFDVPQCSPEEVQGPEMCDGLGSLEEGNICRWYEIHIPEGSIVQMNDVNLDN